MDLVRKASGAGRFDRFRRGLAAIPSYLIFVGAGHVVLGLIWSDRTQFMPREGQAFLGLLMLGFVFAMLGVLTAPFAIPADRDVSSILRGALVGFAVAAAVVAYTASLGYATGGTPGELHCIVEQGREVCPPGNGTYITDGKPDLILMLVATSAAYALSHIVNRVLDRHRARLAERSLTRR